jgi:hypothetical protein
LPAATILGEKADELVHVVEIGAIDDEAAVSLIVPSMGGFAVMMVLDNEAQLQIAEARVEQLGAAMAKLASRTAGTATAPAW